MAVQGASQALVAAFIFGMVVNAASAALFLFSRGRGSSIFRDGPRLVLITFLLMSALWAFIDFITTVIDTTNGTTGCQVGVIFATLFDQMGRFAMEQYLLWVMVTPGKLSAGNKVTQALIAARFVVGGVFVGFTRPQVDTFCVARSSVLPVAIVVIVLDGLIIASLAVGAFTSGLVADAREGKASSPRSKCILFVMAGFVIWTATSVAMLLGMTTVGLIFRTAVPAIGLAILIVVVTACGSGLALPRGSQSSPPEAPSPRRINISRDISTADSSQYPPSRYEDLKDQAIRSSTAFLQPREAPKASEDIQGLPRIARPITGVAGMGGVPVQGALFPPTRVMTGTVPTAELARTLSNSAQKQKRGLFDFVRGGAAAGSPSGKLAIGHPILLDNDDQNPLNKIATIDLNEAVRAEQDRRAMALRQGSDLVAKRPAPQPPNITREEALKRSVSLKRKEVASIPPLPAVPVGLQPVNMSSTTSAQLSPGVEEIRRRSPRQLPADYQDPPLQRPTVPPPNSKEPRVVPVPAEQISEAEQPLVASPAQFRPVTPPVVEKPRDQSPPQPLVVRPGIRPSRKLSSPKKEATTPGQPKTPLQRRPTTGLPPGPRARKVDVAKETGSQAQQTVLFVNNIVYDDPNEVQRIIDGASHRASKVAPRPRTPERPPSVVHRPRPIPRKHELGTEETRKHMRSKSGGSLISRKSILLSTAGSPTQLPPLPPCPKSAGLPSRPQPNDTKSMTVDEKMGLFFPSTPPEGNKRKSSVPELPPVPRAFLGSNPSPTDEVGDGRRSNRTTKTSLQTENLFEVDRSSPTNPVDANGLSLETNFADEVGGSWLPGNPDFSRQTQETRASTEGDAAKRGSSPVIPLRQSAWTETTESRTRDTRDDSTSNWGSLYSPEVAVGFQVAPQVARTTSIRRAASRSIKGKGLPPSVDERSSGELVDIVLDAGSERELRSDKPWLSGQNSRLQPQSASEWHRRVGDECPSFSERKEKTRSRKVPPPTPLLLNAGSNKKTMVIHTAEPSPIESPEQALQQIQEQLRRFEQPNRDSVESEGQRLALLENLEKEMGAQETHWLELQHDLGRNSTSSIGTASSNRTSRRESVIAPAVREAPPPPPKASTAQERRDMRRSRIRSGSTAKTREPSLQVPAISRASAWQQKLAQAEAEMEYMDDSRDGTRLRSFNFLTVSKAQLASPTPPDSDQSDEEVAIAPVRPARLDATVAQATRRQPRQHLLWAPAPTTAHTPSRLLWSPPTRSPRQGEPVLPGLSVRPAPRKESAPLRIASTQLWRKPYRKPEHTTGLWRPSWATPQPAPARPVSALQSNPSQPSPSGARPRPVTQRPPRRNRRVTLLPDIVEDPQPLPNKRGTLGIFQFPWGERSDTASVVPAPAPAVRPATRGMAMPGTMASGGMGIGAARARVEVEEYESSFFDEYDDEDLGLGVEDETEDEEDEDDEDDDSGDDFDETTLWEIASLLKTDSILSKQSLFSSPMEGELADDYLGDMPSDGEGEEREWDDEIVIGLSEEQSRKPGLWQLPPKTPGKGEHGAGLPDPDETTWAKDAAAATFEAARVNSRLDEVPVIESDSLWTPENKEADVAPIWIGGGKPATISEPAEAESTGNNNESYKLGALWRKPASTAESVLATGLFKIDSKRSDFRTTSAEPAAKHMSRRPRPVEHKPLDRLVSTGMWTNTRSYRARFQQLSHGMWAPPRVNQPTESTGLFAVDRTRTEWRTTSAEPAAKSMSRRRRPAEHRPLATLVSTAMWANARSEQPSHGMWSPPKARQPTGSSGLFTADQSRTDWRTTSAEPAAKAIDRKARPTEQKPLDKLSSTRLWAARPRQKSRRNWLASPTHLRRPAASKADWTAALASALSASYPSHAHSHRTATSADWASALSSALALSYPSASASPSPDPSTTHPVFFTPSLTTRSSSFHPAATGYTHDIAATHPAFFGSLSVTCPVEAVHPAIAEFVAGEVESAERERVRREALEEEIRRLEEEKAVVARMAGEIYRDRVVGGSWEGEGEEVVVGGSAAVEEIKEERVSRKSSRSRREKEERRAEILAQIRAIEEAGELDTFGGGSEERGGSRKSGVVLRY